MIDTITTPTTATITWIISEVTYTPENYTVIYGTTDDTLNNTSDIIMTRDINNLQFITATNEIYSVTINGLMINQMYYFRICAVNTINESKTDINTFITSEAGK